EDLAKWDISMIDQKVLSSDPDGQRGTATLRRNGLSTRYGLGLFLASGGGRRSLSHGGEVSGFTAENTVFPDDRAAIVVLTNQDAAGASDAITGAIAPLLFASADAATPGKSEQARKIFDGLQKGTIDRTLFTDNANFYFSQTALKDFADSLAPFGAPQAFNETSQSARGGMTLRVYIARFASGKVLRIWTFELPNGKLEQYEIAPAA